MAYVLGFFAADGNMLRNKRGGHFIEFQVTDKQVLVDIRNAVGSSHKLTARNRSEKWKTNYRLQIGSKEWFSDLLQLGFTPAKSNTLKFPHVPIKMLPDFVRGYFDGDGGVYFRKHKIKNRTNPRWVFSSHFTSGSKQFLERLHISLKTSNVKGGFIVTKWQNKGFDLVLSHHDSVALYRLMYNNAPCIYLKRKYRDFKKALKTLYGKELRA
jgi:hypothetical protein